MTSPIVTVTLNPTIDRTLRVEQVLPDRKLRATGERRDPGGGGINVARAVTRLGGGALALWSCGGPLGELLGGLLADESVPERRVSIRGDTRENVIVREESSGDGYRFGVPGPELEKNELEAWTEALAALDPRPGYLVLSGSLPLGVPEDFYGTLVRSAADGTRVIVDAKGEALEHALEAGPWMVKPNVNELGALVGRELEGAEDVAAAARSLVADGPVEMALVSLGAGGALLATGDGVEHLRSPSVRPRSRVGAGDSMVGGVVLGLARGRPPEEAARLGVAAGAAAVMTEGTELCRGEDAWRLFEGMGPDAA